MSKAKPLTRVHTRSEQDSIVRRGGSRRYTRANSPSIVHGEQGGKTENIRGRYSDLDQVEARKLKHDKILRARAFGRRNKHTAQVASLKKA